MIEKIIDWTFVGIFVILVIVILFAIGLATYQGNYVVSLFLTLIMMPVVTMVMITYIGATK